MTETWLTRTRACACVLVKLGRWSKQKNRSHFHISTRTPPYNPQIPITLHKEKDYDQEGREILKCGFKIGGGIDQDYKKSPQGYTDYVREC